MSDKLKIDPEFRDLIPRPSLVEVQLLEDKLKSEGCNEMLIGWQDDPDNKGGTTLIDGHTRQAICEKLGIGYGVRLMRFGSREAVRVWMRKSALGRRNLTDDQRAAIAFDTVKDESEIAMRERAQKGRESGGACKPEEAEKRLSAQTADKRSEKPAQSAKAPKEKKDTRAAVAKGAKVSEKKIRGVAEVEKKSPGMAKKIAAGEVTLREAKKEVAEKAKEEAKPETPPADQNGVPLPDSKPIRDAFAGRVGAQAILNQITALTKAHNEHRETPAGVTLRPYEPRIKAAIGEVRNLITSTQPWIICADCHGEGCDRCRKLGWHDKETAARR